MPRIRPTIAITLAAVLAYVSGLAMHLHVVWEHGTPVIGQVEAAHSGCSHGHDHGHRHRHGHGHHHDHDHHPDHAPGSDQPGEPWSGGECPTCVALAAFAATVAVADSAGLVDLLPCANLSVESRRAAHMISLAHLPSRGPPAVI